MPLLGDTIGENLERTVAAHGEREAMVECATGRRWTYAELDRDVNAPGPRPARAPASPRATGSASGRPTARSGRSTQYATAKIGAILVNINPAYRTHELGYALNQSGTRLLVSATSFKTSDYRAMVDEVRPDCHALEQVVWIGDDSWDELVRGGESQPDDAVATRMGELSPDDPINIQYTSGTTGYPKGATLSHHNILNNGYFVTEGSGSPRTTGSASRCPSTTASAW